MNIIFDKRKLIPGKQVYQCNTCGKVFNWDSDSCWYGSHKQMETHPEKIKYYCCEDCFIKEKIS